MALIPESHVDARTAPIYQQYPDVETTILAGAGEIQLHFALRQAHPAPRRRHASTNSPKRSKPRWTTPSSPRTANPSKRSSSSISAFVNLTLATAESCTGGLLAQRLTAIPGSSRYFLGGAVVYSDALKTTFADVPAELVATQGPRLARSRALPRRRHPHPHRSIARHLHHRHRWPRPRPPAPTPTNPSASSTSLSPTPSKPRSKNSISPATANASAGGPASTPSNSSAIPALTCSPSAI